MTEKTVYLPLVILDENQRASEYLVVKGLVIREISEEEVVVQVKAPDGKTEDLNYLRKNLTFNEDDAHEKLFNLQTSTRLRAFSKRFPRELIPQEIAPANGGRFTGNPLRFSEPGMGFGAQSNTFGKSENPQKVIQTAGAVYEDLEVLMGILDLMYLTNDYSKKLIGKYIIIELNSLFVLLKKLKNLDKVYESKYFVALEGELANLESKHGFKLIRDKIAAHRDVNLDITESTSCWNNITRYSISKHIELFSNHLNAFLTDLYPWEKKQYFLLRHTTVKFEFVSRENVAYKPFEDRIFKDNDGK